jgi:hypothetical protein
MASMVVVCLVIMSTGAQTCSAPMSLAGAKTYSVQLRAQGLPPGAELIQYRAPDQGQAQ